MKTNEAKNKWSKKFDIRQHRCSWTVQFYSPGGPMCILLSIYRKPKMVAMATSLRTWKSAMSSSDSLHGPENPRLESNSVSLLASYHITEVIAN